jgi:hypothetical protein
MKSTDIESGIVVEESVFGKLDGVEIKQFKIFNANGISFTCNQYGATITSKNVYNFFYSILINNI